MSVHLRPLLKNNCPSDEMAAMSQFLDIKAPEVPIIFEMIMQIEHELNRLGGLHHRNTFAFDLSITDKDVNELRKFFIFGFGKNSSYKTFENMGLDSVQDSTEDMQQIETILSANRINLSSKQKEMMKGLCWV